MTSITIPDSVTSIGRYAFAYCSSLTSITIPDSVTSIGYYAFNHCGSLANVSIGNGVNAIGSGVFAYCPSLKDFVIPNSITTIGSYAFEGSELNSITIPSGLQSIGMAAFTSLTSIESVYITDLKRWLNIDFDNMASNPLYYSASNLYLNGKLVTQLIIPDGVTEIPKYAFSGYKNLTSITIPASVTSIGTEAFDECYKLIEVINNSSLTIEAGSTSNGYVGYYAKYVINNCNYYFETFYDTTYLISCISDDAIIVLPDNYHNCAYKIYDYAFSGCTHLTDVTISDNITAIPRGAFNMCCGLNTVTIPDSVTAIGDCAFRYCDNLNTFIYNGTKSQWNLISKVLNWDKDTPDYIVTCTDGTIAKDGTET